MFLMHVDSGKPGGLLNLNRKSEITYHVVYRGRRYQQGTVLYREGRS